MADFYQICVGGIYLTKDGNIQAAGIGKRCSLTVDGVPALQSKYLKNRFNDYRGNPIIQKTKVGTAGRALVVNIDGILPSSVATEIITLHQSSEENDTVIRLIGDDTDTPSFDVYVLPDREAFTWKGPDGFGSYTGAVLRYVCVGSTFLFDQGNRLVDGGDRMTD